VEGFVIIWLFCWLGASWCYMKFISWDVSPSVMWLSAIAAFIFNALRFLRDPR